MQRLINLVILHCSDSDIPEHDNIDIIRKWHVEENGWQDVGYHYFIRKCGRVEAGRPEDVIGAHCKGYNKQSIGICLSGRSEFTQAQFLSAAELIKKLLVKYELEIRDILGHRELNKGKTCPNFDLNNVLKLIV